MFHLVGKYEDEMKDSQREEQKEMIIGSDEKSFKGGFLAKGDR